MKRREEKTPAGGGVRHRSASTQLCVRRLFKWGFHFNNGINNRQRARVTLRVVVIAGGGCESKTNVVMMISFFRTLSIQSLV